MNIRSVLAVVLACVPNLVWAATFSINLAYDCANSGGVAGSCNHLGGYNDRVTSGAGNLVRMNGTVTLDRIGTGLTAANFIDWAIQFTGPETGSSTIFTPANSGSPLAYGLTHAWTGGSGNGLEIAATESNLTMTFTDQGLPNSTASFRFVPHIDTAEQLPGFPPGLLFQPVGDQLLASISNGSDGSHNFSSSMNAVGPLDGRLGDSASVVLPGVPAEIVQLSAFAARSSLSVSPASAPSFGSMPPYTVVLGSAIEDSMEPIPLPPAGAALFGSLGAIYGLRRMRKRKEV